MVTGIRNRDISRVYVSMTEEYQARIPFLFSGKVQKLNETGVNLISEFTILCVFH